MADQVSVLGVDPGPATSGVCLVSVRDRKILGAWSSLPNDELVEWILGALASSSRAALAAVEVIEARGMPLGKATAETALWAGRIFQHLDGNVCPGAALALQRREVKAALGVHPGGNDGDVKKAVFSVLGPISANAAKSQLKSHAVQAAAVAIAAAIRHGLIR